MSKNGVVDFLLQEDEKRLESIVEKTLPLLSNEQYTIQDAQDVVARSKKRIGELLQVQKYVEKAMRKLPRLFRARNVAATIEDSIEKLETMCKELLS